MKHECSNKPHIQLNLEQIQQLLLYRQELDRFNQKFSLISRQSSAEGRPIGFRLAEKKADESVDESADIQPNYSQILADDRRTHLVGLKEILDSLVAGHLLLKGALPGPIADIGSGAGLPGLILAILDPQRAFYLYEVNQKKPGFLEYMAYQLNLKNVQVKNISIQQEKPILSQAVSKAFFSLEKRLDLSAPAFKNGARYYHLQSSFAGPKGFSTLEKTKSTKGDEVSPTLAEELKHKCLNKRRIKQAWTLVSAEPYSYPPFLSERVLLRTDLKIS